MTDYSHLPNEKLNERVAELRGWKRIGKQYKIGEQPMINRFSGHLVQEPVARTTWVDFNGDEAPLPDWVSSLDRAWELFAEFDEDPYQLFEITTAGLVVWARTNINEFRCWGTEGLLPARAICEAWLWWMEQHADV